MHGKGLPIEYKEENSILTALRLYSYAVLWF